MELVIWIALLSAFGYWASLHLHPWTRCRRCRGSSRHFGAVYSYASRACGHCGGTGRVVRLGVRLFLGGTEKR